MYEKCEPGTTCNMFLGRLTMMGNTDPTPAVATADFTNPSSTSSMRRRTVTEAIERAMGPVDLASDTFKMFPLSRPYAKALKAMTYGLIVLDPLDRLEGGLID